MQRVAAALFFLVVHRSLRGVVVTDPASSGRALRIGGAAAAALLGAFSFTNWQNSNETEVYTVATLTIAAMSWSAVTWRSRRGTDRAPRLLLLIVYLAGVSVANHLLALLAVPGVLLFLVVTLWDEPASDPARRRAEWGQVAVVAGVWALLVGAGLGSASLTAIGGLFLAAAVFAGTQGAGAFAVLALLLRRSASRRTRSSISGRRSTRSSTRPRPRRWTPCWPSSGEPSIRRVPRWMTPPCRTAPTTPAARSLCSSGS